APRPGPERLPAFRAARRAEAPADPARGRRLGRDHHGGAGSGADEGDAQARVSARSAGHQRRPGDAAAGAAEPRAQRVPGHARRRHGPDRLPRVRARPRRGRRGRHRRRHSTRAPREDLRPLLHDQGAGLGHRPLDGLSYRPAPRRRSRGPVDSWQRDQIPPRLPTGVNWKLATGDWRLETGDWELDAVSWKLRVAPLIVLAPLIGVGACVSASARSKPAEPALIIPPPPPHVVPITPEPVLEPVADVPSGTTGPQ